MFSSNSSNRGQVISLSNFTHLALASRHQKLVSANTANWLPPAGTQLIQSSLVSDPSPSATPQHLKSHGYRHIQHISFPNRATTNDLPSLVYLAEVMLRVSVVRFVGKFARWVIMPDTPGPRKKERRSLFTALSRVRDGSLHSTTEDGTRENSCLGNRLHSPYGTRQL
jgi:hypothetical protein